ILRTFYKNKSDNDIDTNINMIELFQNQRPVHNTCNKINDYYKNCAHTDYIPKINFGNTTDEENNLNYLFDESIGNIGDYLKAVDNIIHSFKNINENPPIWFRGVCNMGYDLRPGIFRNLKDDRSLYAFLTDNLKKLHEKTAAYPNFWERMPSIIDQITCLQHYGGATNFMDFSTDPLTSLHFAINPDNEEDKNKSADAVVYIFNPRLFNKNMDKIFHKDSSRGIYHAYCATLLHDKNYKCYIPTDFSDHYIEKQNEKYRKALKASEPPAFSKMNPPRTLIVPQNNDRIRAQYGTFVVYPLDIWPDTKCSTTNSNDYFEYTCLLKLQDKIVKDRGDRFIEKIIIRSSSLEYLRQQLLHLGITTARMYPELDKIIKEL
ncbi:MAG: FRG domain-containing protein, partial [Lachnospiraceae bacterium]|nr:FRG domain-containing protein [Lachnospiraceae bacterium]